MFLLSTVYPFFRRVKRSNKAALQPAFGETTHWDAAQDCVVTCSVIGVVVIMINISASRMIPKDRRRRRRKERRRKDNSSRNSNFWIKLLLQKKLLFGDSNKVNFSNSTIYLLWPIIRLGSQVKWSLKPKCFTFS